MQRSWAYAAHHASTTILVLWLCQAGFPHLALGFVLLLGIEGIIRPIYEVIVAAQRMDEKVAAKLLRERLVRKLEETTSTATDD